jgi:hypothetical protein
MDHQQEGGIRYAGRLFAVKFEKTPKENVSKLTLGIAEHPTPEETVFHRKVVCTRELADALNSLDPPLKIGEKVLVEKAYPYKWPYTGPDGTQRYNEGETLWIIRVRDQRFAAKRQRST